MDLDHLSWERAVRVDGMDRLTELLQREGASTGMVGLAASS